MKHIALALLPLIGSILPIGALLRADEIPPLAPGKPVDYAPICSPGKLKSSGIGSRAEIHPVSFQVRQLLLLLGVIGQPLSRA